MLRARVVALLFMLIWGINQPVSLLLAQSGDASLTVRSVTAVYQRDTGVVKITYDLLGSTDGRVTTTLEYREGKRDEWVPMKHVTDTDRTAITSGETRGATWNARCVDSIFDTDAAQVRVIASIGETRAVGVSPPFKLDTNVPLGCSCGYPGYEETGVPLDALFIATKPNDSSPPIEYRFRLGRTGAEKPLMTTDWSTSSRWTPEGLEPATRYWWQVEARDAFGNESGWNIAVRFTTVDPNEEVVKDESSGDSQNKVLPDDSSMDATHGLNTLFATSASLNPLLVPVAGTILALIAALSVATWRKH